MIKPPEAPGSQSSQNPASSAPMPPEVPSQVSPSVPSLAAGPFAAYPYDDEIYLKGKPFSVLCTRERRLMRALMQQPNQLMTYERVMVVIGIDPTNTTTAHRKFIERLRHKLEGAGLHNCLVTVAAHGVLLVC